MLLSTPLDCCVSATPLLLVTDFRPSLMLPDHGLKKVSSLNTPDQPLPKSSWPFRPIFDWPRLLPLTEVTEPLLFFWMKSLLPAGW